LISFFVPGASDQSQRRDVSGIGAADWLQGPATAHQLLALLFAQ